MERPEHNEMRDNVTRLFAYTRMDDPLWQKVADAFDWTDAWPVIDGDCRLTGEVVEPTDWDYFPHYPSFDAVIRRDVAEAAGWLVDIEEGHARPKGDEEMTTNEDRAGYAAAACKAYEKAKAEYGADEIGNVIVDLIADLLHLADREGAGSERCLRVAAMHYAEESAE